jgi:hypothetical protein
MCLRHHTGARQQQARDLVHIDGARLMPLGVLNGQLTWLLLGHQCPAIAARIFRAVNLDDRGMAA